MENWCHVVVKMMKLIPEAEQLRVEHTNMIRKFTEKHIDYLCSNKQYLNSRLTILSVYPMSWNYCALSRAVDGYNKVKLDWRIAISEFIDWFLVAVNQQYYVYGSNNKVDYNRIVDPTVRSNYDICLKVSKMIITDEERIHRHKMMVSLRKVIKKGEL